MATPEVISPFQIIYNCTKDVKLVLYDKIIFIVGGFISVAASFFLIIAYIVDKRLRARPGDIILLMSIADLILSIQWMITAIFNDILYDNYTFCFINSIISTVAGVTSLLYDITFCLYFVFLLRSTLNPGRIPRKTFYLANTVITISFTLFFLFNNELGKSMFGTCSIADTCKDGNKSYFIASSVIFLYMVIGIFCLWYIRSHLSQGIGKNTKNAEISQYYMKYIIASTIIYTTFAITYILSLYDGEKSDILLLSIGNTAKLCSPLVLSLVRYKDPLITKIMKQVFTCSKQRKKISVFNKSTSQFPLDSVFLTENNNESYIDNKEINKMEISSEDRYSISEFGFNEIIKTRKLQLTYTLLSGVMLSMEKIKNDDRSHEGSLTRSIIMEFQRKQEIPKMSKKIRSFNLDENRVEASFPKAHEHLKRVGNILIPGKWVCHAFPLFAELIKEDYDILDIIESLDFDMNLDAINAAGANDGGRGGEFFFFSSDNKLVIKTIPSFELKSLLEIIGGYTSHFRSYPYSLISKIYGAFTYTSQGNADQLHVVISKNVCGFSEDYIMRKYDIKGSSVDREVTLGYKKEEKFQALQKFKGKTLKDEDFRKYEGTIDIGDDAKEKVFNQLVIDVKFFEKANIIDYSFFITVVDKEKYFTDICMEKEKILYAEKNNLAFLPSINPEMKGINYTIGIIDYLQPYNITKKGEKLFKMIKTFNSQANVSVQAPKVYSNRVIQVMEDILK